DSMKEAFLETRGFTELLEQFMSDQEYAEIQSRLLKNPECGDVIPGCGGIRKLRVPDVARGKGKRGGARLLYIYFPEVKKFYMVTIYGKNVKRDVSMEEKKELKE